MSRRQPDPDALLDTVPVVFLDPPEPFCTKLAKSEVGHFFEILKILTRRLGHARHGIFKKVSEKLKKCDVKM